MSTAGAVQLTVPIAGKSPARNVHARKRPADIAHRRDCLANSVCHRERPASRTELVNAIRLKLLHKMPRSPSICKWVRPLILDSPVSLATFLSLRQSSQNLFSHPLFFLQSVVFHFNNTNHISLISQDENFFQNTTLLGLLFPVQRSCVSSAIKLKTSEQRKSVKCNKVCTPKSSWRPAKLEAVGEGRLKCVSISAIWNL